MLFSIHGLRDFVLQANDGPIGSIVDVHFDEFSWRIEHIVVATGRWLPGRRVLLSPFSLGDLDQGRKSLATYLNRDQVRNSPRLETAQPVSRHKVQELYAYWGTMATAAPIGRASGAASGNTEPPARLQAADAEAPSRLRSAAEVSGYYVDATDGDCGHVEDFIGDDGSWTIKYLLVDTRNWLPGRKVLVSAPEVSHISWTERRTRLNLTCQQVLQSPEFELLRR